VAHARVTLNRAVAAAMDDGAAAGLALVQTVRRAASRAPPPRCRAGALLEMNGDPEAAIVHDEAAAGRTTSVAERNCLVIRAARLAAQTAECGHENRPKRARDNALMLP
jgi:predicted RNA polymerase sigma factor